MHLNHERNPHIDNIKGIGILLVIIGHLIPRGYLWNIIYGLHMPLFVFCSGLVEKNSLNWRRLCKYLLYYVVMGSVACGIYFLTDERDNIFYLKQSIYNILVSYGVNSVHCG